MLVLLSGGKTMGHISPLLAINQKLKNECDIIYIGCPNSMEEECAKKNNIEFYPVDVYPFYRKKLYKNILTFKQLFKESNRIRKDFKNKQIKLIVSSGGFVSLPVLLAFRNKRQIKKILLEANMVLGLANRFLYYYVDSLFTQFPLKYKKAINCGYPVFLPTSNFDHPFFYQKKPLILAVGGSNGALEIVELIYEFHKKHSEYNVILVTGNRYFEKYQFNDNVKVYKKIDGLPSLFTRVDLLISRAGGATISEALSVGVPLLLVPSRIVAADHQYKNALFLQKIGAATLYEGENLADIIYSLIHNDSAREDMLTKQHEYMRKTAGLFDKQFLKM